MEETSLSQESTVPTGVSINLDWDELYEQINPALFTTFRGNPIIFYFELEDDEEKAKWNKLVCLGNGGFVDTIGAMDSRTALMLDDLNTSRRYSRPSFKLSYISNCVKENALLDISDYLHNDFYKKSDHYMNVIFFETDSFIVDSGTRSPNREEVVHKRTREPYTLHEKETILKFIISKPRRNFGLSGNSIWKTMELRNVCPRRTYQSLKNHFRKFLVKELDRFEFLTESDKKFLRGET